MNPATSQEITELRDLSNDVVKVLQTFEQSTQLSNFNSQVIKYCLCNLLTTCIIIDICGEFVSDMENPKLHTFIYSQVTSLVEKLIKTKGEKQDGNDNGCTRTNNR